MNVLTALAIRINARLTLVQSIDRSPDSNSPSNKTAHEWVQLYTTAANDIVKKYLPSGSGFDAGSLIDWETTQSEYIVISAPFHPMDAHGYYKDWVELMVAITPSLIGFNLHIMGSPEPEVDELKDYVHQVFSDCLQAEIDVEDR